MELNAEETEAFLNRLAGSPDGEILINRVTCNRCKNEKGIDYLFSVLYTNPVGHILLCCGSCGFAFQAPLEEGVYEFEDYFVVSKDGKYGYMKKGE